MGRVILSLIFLRWPWFLKAKGSIAKLLGRWPKLKVARASLRSKFLFWEPFHVSSACWKCADFSRNILPLQTTVSTKELFRNINTGALAGLWWRARLLNQEPIKSLPQHNEGTPAVSTKVNICESWEDYSSSIFQKGWNKKIDSWTLKIGATSEMSRVCDRCSVCIEEWPLGHPLGTQSTHVFQDFYCFSHQWEMVRQKMQKTACKYVQRFAQKIAVTEKRQKHYWAQ